MKAEAMLRCVIAGVVLLAIGSAGNVAAASVDRDMVPDSATAIKVANAILETWMGKDQFAATIKNAPLKAELDGDTWSVYPYPTDIGREERLPNGVLTVIVSAGGGPIIELSKHDAQVKRIYFNR